MKATHRATLHHRLFILTLIMLGAGLAPTVLIAAPLVPCAVITRYGIAPDPRTISFAPDGTLHVGRDNTESGGGPGDLVKIHRIGPGGSPVVEFGGTAIADPDGVVFDAAGTVSSLAGSIIVGSSRKFSRIVPSGAVSLHRAPHSPARTDCLGKRDDRGCGWKPLERE